MARSHFNKDHIKARVAKIKQENSAIPLEMVAGGLCHAIKKATIYIIHDMQVRIHQCASVTDPAVHELTSLLRSLYDFDFEITKRLLNIKVDDGKRILGMLLELEKLWNILKGNKFTHVTVVQLNQDATKDDVSVHNKLLRSVGYLLQVCMEKCNKKGLILRLENCMALNYFSNVAVAAVNTFALTPSTQAIMTLDRVIEIFHETAPKYHLPVPKFKMFSEATPKATPSPAVTQANDAKTTPPTQQPPT